MRKTARRTARKTTKQTHKEKNDIPTIGKAIVFGSIVGLVVNLLVQNTLGDMASLEAGLVLGIILAGLVGITTSALTQSTRRPLYYSLSSSFISVAIIQIVLTLIGSVVLGDVYLTGYVALMNIITAFPLIVIAGIANAIYWWLLVREEDNKWLKNVFDKMKDWKKYIGSLIAVVAIFGVTLVPAEETWLSLGLLFVNLIILAALITYLIGKKENIVKTIAVSILISIIVGIAFGLPFAGVFYVSSATGIATLLILSFVFGTLIAIATSLAPALAAMGEGISAIRDSVLIAKQEFFQLTGMLVLVGVILFIAEFVVSLISPVMGDIGTVFEIVVSAGLIEFGIVSLGEITKKLHKR